MIRIGVIGHRFFNNPGDAGFVAKQCNDILKKVLKTHKNIVALSPIAEGADSIFAEAALSLNIPLEIVRPFDEFENDFITPEAKEAYTRLRASASKETRLANDKRSTEAYIDAMHWMLQNSDITIVAWNEKAEGGKGGTADAIEYILQSGQDWIHLNVSDHSVTYHIKKNIISFHS